MTAHVKILCPTGLGTDTVIEIDGERPKNVLAFRLVGSHPDEATKLILEIDAGPVEIEGQFEVVHESSAAASDSSETG